MKYVLDTDVFKFVSSTKRKPNIDAWLRAVRDRDIYITVITLQESVRGIELLKNRRQPSARETAHTLERALGRYVEKNGNRILTLGSAAAIEWGRRLACQGTKNSNDLAILSIIATQHDAIVVTMNVDDFANRGVTVIDPSKNPAAIIESS